MRRAVGYIAASAAVLLGVACGSSDGSGDGAALANGELPEAGAASDGGAGGDGSIGGDGGVAGDGSADGAPEAAVDAGPPAVQFVGRFDQTPADGPKTAWPSGRIIANFMGTEVKVTLGDVPLFDPSYGASRWEVFIDGLSHGVIQLDRTVASKQYTLATGLVSGPHNVEIYKITEASVGTTQFLGFDFSGGTLLPPPPLPARHLQFLGDSSSNGYGIEGTSPCAFSAATQNERLSYPALIATALNADHHNLGASGKGIYQDYYRPDTDTFPVIYQFDGVTKFPHTSWDYTQYTPDVVWITLGGNDYDDVGAPTPDPPPYAQFEAKYDALVTTIRSQHPNAHIVCAVAPSLSDAYPAGFNAYTNVKNAATAVVAAHNGAADPKVYTFEFTRSVDADLTGCGGHPNATKHQKMATEATTFIKSKTGWP